jgi:hypothetical protein
MNDAAAHTTRHGVLALIIAGLRAVAASVTWQADRAPAVGRSHHDPFAVSQLLEAGVDGDPSLCHLPWAARDGRGA